MLQHMTNILRLINHIMQHMAILLQYLQEGINMLQHMTSPLQNVGHMLHHMTFLLQHKTIIFEYLNYSTRITCCNRYNHLLKKQM